MTSTEYYDTLTDDRRPAVPEPQDLVDADWVLGWE